MFLIEKFNDVIKKEFKNYSIIQKIGVIFAILLSLIPATIVLSWFLLALFAFGNTFIQFFHVFLFNANKQLFYDSLPLSGYILFITLSILFLYKLKVHLDDEEKD